MDSLDAQPGAAVPHCTAATPCKENRYSFRPENVEDHYLRWTGIHEMSGLPPSLGILENRRNALIDIDKDRLEQRMVQYLNPAVDWESLHSSGLTRDAARFHARNARAKILSREAFDSSRLRRVLVAPMDHRWCYYTAVRPVWNEPRPSLEEQVRDENACFMSRRKRVGDPSAVPFFFTTTIGLQHSLHKDAYYFPLRLTHSVEGNKANGQGSFLDDGVAQPPSAVQSPQAGAPVPHRQNATANLSPAARAYLAGLGVTDLDRVAQPPSAVRSAKSSPAQYRRNLPHIQTAEKPMYVTFCTYKKWTLPEEVRKMVLEHCLHDHGRKYWLHAAVVMPDHVHMILSVYGDAAGQPFGLPEILNGIKGASAHSVNKALGRKGHVWQDESFDHILRSSESAEARSEYIRNNPVRKGLVETAEEWPWFWGDWMSLPEEGTAGGGCATYDLIWMHALAVGYSPAYLCENADGIRRDWPRVPLPDTLAGLEASAALGRQLAALLDTEADVPGVTAAKVEPVFRTVGVLAKVGSCGSAAPGREDTAEGGCATQLDPDAGDLAVAASWGHAGKDGVTMPGKGRIVQRPYDNGELEAIAHAADALGFSQKQALALLGPDTRDVYLSDKAYWRNVPANVWEYYIGGYQVIKKWLSYREQELLGRALRSEEAREVTGMARRLAAIVLLQPALDANYEVAKSHAYPWPTGETGAATQ